MSNVASLIENAKLARLNLEREDSSIWSERFKNELVDLRQMMTVEPDELDFFIKDRVVSGRGFLITGLGGSSKTRMLYHLAIGAAIGRLPWGWEICKRGKSVLFLNEDTEQDIHRTLFHMARVLNLTEDEIDIVADNVIIKPLAGEVFQLLELNNGSLRRTPLFDACVNYVTDLGNVCFVGLDPALSLTQGDELNQGHQRALGQCCDHIGVLTGASTAMVSHASKGISSKEELDSHNSRGGGAITDAVRAEITMRSMTPDEARKANVDINDRHSFVQVVVTKANHLPPSAKTPIWLERHAGGTLLLADVELSNDSMANIKKELECLNVLIEMSRESVPKTSVWGDECLKRGIFTIKQGCSNPDAAKRKAFARIVTKLEKGQLIERGTNYATYVPKDAFFNGQ